jgi:hypothetical protein
MIGAPIQFVAGAYGTILAHDLAQAQISWELDSGSGDPAEDGVFRGASTSNPDGGTARTGSGVTQLVDTTKGWSIDEFNGDWVVLRPGLATEEWQRISDTQASPSTLIPETNFTQLSVGDAYAIYSNQQETLSGFLRGSPQDFTAEVSVGDYFSVPSVGTLFQIQARTARTLTLATAWANADLLGTTFSVTRDFTANRSFPILHPRDAQAAAIVGRFAVMTDAQLVVTLLTLPAYLDSWLTYTLPGSPASPRYFKDGFGRVGFVGAVERGSAPSSPSSIIQLAAAYRPLTTQQFIVGGGDSAGGTLLEVDTSGFLKWIDGEYSKVFLNTISYMTSASVGV